MSTRKIVRNGMRRDAERYGVNSAKYVNHEFEKYQIKKYGAEIREINKAKGTKKRRTWRERIESVIYAVKERQNIKNKERALNNGKF